VKIGGVWVGGSGIVALGEGLPGLECEKKLGWNGRGAGEKGNMCSSRRMFCEMNTFVLIANLSNYEHVKLEFNEFTILTNDL
jgi:hypothetical protein